MKKNIIKIIKIILPVKWVNILMMKPRLMFVDIHTAKHISWLWKQVSVGINHRGNESSSLRKQAHILEKGLQIPNREPGHSKAQYSVVKDKIQESFCEESNKWANNILKLYEQVQDNKCINKDVYIPFRENELDLEMFENFSKSRRSIRNFKKEKVSNELISRIAQLVNWSPNSCNRQNTKIYITSDDKKIKKCMKLNGGATCMNQPSHFISIVSDTRSYMLPVEFNAAYIDASLAGQNFILGLHSAGISSCVLNWTHASKNQEMELRKELEIDEQELVIFNMVIGYPEFNIQPSSKKISQQTIIFK